MTKISVAQAPLAIKKPQTLTKHNHQRVDDYYWMNERDSKPVLEHLAKENEYQSEYFKPLKPLIDGLMKEFDQRINPNDVSAPYILNGLTFQSRNIEGKDYQQVVLLENKKTTIFIDENERAKGKSFYELADWSLSPDNKMVALTEDLVGRRKYQITFRVNKSGKFLTDKIEDASGLVWANDNKTVFYTKKDPQTLREFQVYKHVLGTDAKKDELVYQEEDEKFSVGIGKTGTDKYLFIYCYSSTTTELHWIDADKPQEKPQVFLPRRSGHMYEVAHHDKGFYILTNADGASNRKVLFSPSFPRNLNQCKDFIPHKNEVLIEGLTAFKNFLVIEERSNGLRGIKLINVNDQKESTIAFDEETYFLGLGVNDNYNTDDLFFSYNSLTTPSTVYRYNMVKQEKTLWFRKELLDKGFNPENYSSQRVWATANDGTKIPVSLVYKKGTDLKKAPCLLYGYGSYGYTLPDVFSATRLSLLDRGFVYAVAHIRGSKYMGENWYENGKFQKKIITFTDFINAADFLGHIGYCYKNKIYAQG